MNISYVAPLKSTREFCHKGRLFEALHALDIANQEGSSCSNKLLSSLLQWCIDRKNANLGRRVHCTIVRRQLECNSILASYLVRMFTACGNLQDADKVFNTVPNPNIFMWSAIILAHANLGSGAKSIDLYQSLLQCQMLRPDAHTFVAVLKACSTTGALHEGKLVHANIVESSVDLVLHVGNILIDMYVRCKSLEDGHAVFEKMPERDAVTWNSIIAGYSCSGHDEKAYELCRSMKEGGIEPDNVTFLSLLGAFSNANARSKGDFSSLRSEDHEHEVEIQNGIGSSRLEYAWNLFVKLPNRSLTAWTAMIAAYAEYGDCNKALHLYLELLKEGLQPDIVTFVCALKACSNLDMGKCIHTHIIESGCELDLQVRNCLIDVYGQSGGLEDARLLFENMNRRCVVTWSSMISAYAHHGQDQDSLELFSKMLQEGMEPNQVTYFSAMKACANITALILSILIYAHVVDTGWDCHMQVNNSAIDMFAKCGSLQDACSVFSRTQKRSVVTWSAMISAYAQHSRHEMSLECFDDMVQEGIKPNSVTYVCLLSACYHLGLVNQGCHHFYTMQRVYGIKPSHEHKNCLVELLGRAGRLKEAADLLQGTPDGSDIVAWMSLLNQCKAHGNAKLAKRCFDNIVSMEPKDASGYMLMINLYADLGMY